MNDDDGSEVTKCWRYFILYLLYNVHILQRCVLPVHRRIYFIVWIFHIHFFATEHANVIFIGCTKPCAAKMDIRFYFLISSLLVRLIIRSYCFFSPHIILPRDRHRQQWRKNYLWLHLIHLLNKFFCPTAFSHSLCTADAFSILQCERSVWWVFPFEPFFLSCRFRFFRQLFLA